MMKQKNKFFIIVFTGYAPILLMIFLLAKNSSYYTLLPDIVYSPIQYIILNAFVFTSMLVMFFNKIINQTAKKRIVYGFLVYFFSLVLGSLLTSILYTFNAEVSDVNILNTMSATFAYSWLMLFLALHLTLLLGVLTIGFIECLNYIYNKRNFSFVIKSNILKYFFSILLGLMIILISIGLKATYKYHKTEKIPDTNLQAVIYLQDNYKTIAIANSSGSYALSYIELQDLEGNTLAKQSFFNRCEVQIGELDFEIIDNKLYFTKFSYIDLTNYKYYCFGNGM